MYEALAVLKAALRLYEIILFARLLMSWFPNINWYNQPFRLLRDLTDPVLEPFRRIIPPVGMMDFSPMVPLFLLQLIIGILPG